MILRSQYVQIKTDVVPCSIHIDKATYSEIFPDEKPTRNFYVVMGGRSRTAWVPPAIAKWLYKHYDYIHPVADNSSEEPEVEEKVEESVIEPKTETPLLLTPKELAKQTIAKRNPVRKKSKGSVKSGQTNSSKTCSGKSRRP